MNLHFIRLSSFFSVISVMFLWETWRPKRKWETARWKRWAFHGAVSVVNTLLTRFSLLLPLLGWIHFVRTQEWGIVSWVGLTGFWEIALTVVVFDMLDYWWHRFNHHIPFLWRFHKYHHYDTHVDVTTALRFQPGELLLSYGVKALWILVWGPSLIAFFVFEALITSYAVFHHSNIDVSDGTEKFFYLTLPNPGTDIRRSKRLDCSLRHPEDCAPTLLRRCLPRPRNHQHPDTLELNRT